MSVFLSDKLLNIIILPILSAEILFEKWNVS